LALEPGPSAGDRRVGGWLHEVKHDAFRILVRKPGERAKVWSRRSADLTDRFSGIAETVRGLSADRALIDGVHGFRAGNETHFP